MTATGAAQSRGPMAPKASLRRRRLLVVVVVFFAIALAFLWYIGVFGGNVRTIEPHRAYRSATLTGFDYTGLTARWIGNDLPAVLRRDQIGTVICLRSGSQRDAWYRQELADCNQVNAMHEDIPMSARSLPSPGTVNRLLDVFDRAKYPILLHCQAGSDRTGFASTLYAHLYEHIPLDQAESEELTWRYGHFPVDKTRAMDQFFDLYRGDAHGLSLRDWIRSRYPQVYGAGASSTGQQSAGR